MSSDSGGCHIGTIIYFMTQINSLVRGVVVIRQLSFHTTDFYALHPVIPQHFLHHVTPRHPVSGGYLRAFLKTTL